jgi:hypothetical protein
MEYAAPRRTLPTRRSLVAPLAALVIGAGAAVGGYALIDDQQTIQVPGEVVVVETPGPGQGVRGIDDMAHAPTASVQPQTVVPYLSHGIGVQTESTKDEARTAGAIGAGSRSQADDTANRTDPHGPASALHR